ncbi:MAG: cytochrome c oxidase assembly factor 1 family protein [Roseiflexus sp.]|uniref:cytochrome c oxidase assembly factor 1 family protein n=1 Tax=Roseiflexus sp. TaxID=2562120 RepID=UPI0025CF9140|nr:cytochrome c oxidase assembly factor 1 family protein [Roseiflexus sp.]MCL6542976.1 cytochrome c oxidase assembly factor 1 family protein [Roseiflexus sp.]
MVTVRRRGCTPLSCLIGGVTFIVVVGCVVGIFAVVISLFRDSDVAQEALARAQRDPQVEAALGRPLEIGWFLPTGSLRTDAGGGGQVNLTLPISGPRGSGKLIISGVRIRGKWEYNRMIVTVDGTGQRIDLLREL